MIPLKRAAMPDDVAGKLRCSTPPTTRTTSPAPTLWSTAAGWPRAIFKALRLEPGGFAIPSRALPSSSSDKERVNASMPTGASDFAESPALSLLSISKSFGPTKALDNVDLVLRRGEVVALLGANGAGKSTLAKIASGVVEPDQGQISINGRPVRFASPRSARESGVVTVHQATDQLGVAGVSVAQNLVLDDLAAALSPRTRAIERKAAEGRCAYWLGSSSRRRFRRVWAGAASAHRHRAGRRGEGLGADPRRADRKPRRGRGLTACSKWLTGCGAQGVAILYISHRMGGHPPTGRPRGRAAQWATGSTSSAGLSTLPPPSGRWSVATLARL